MTNDWKEYQESVAAFFRSLGLEASVDVRLKGVRTTHDIDVVVRSQHIGFEITWLVECKHWKARVSKLHVLAFAGDRRRHRCRSWNTAVREWVPERSS